MNIIEFSSEILLLLFGVALLAGTLDTLAGGGGLIIVPALLITGISPISALATNKIQGCSGSCVASIMMLRTKKVTWSNIKYLMLAAFIGSLIGTIGVHFLNTQTLRFIIPFVVGMTGLYFLCAPLINKLTFFSTLQPHSDSYYRTTSIPLIGLYDGMFGPGAGSFYTLAGVLLKKHPIVEATAQAKTMNFASNIASLAVYLTSGKIIWPIAGVMILGQIMGALIGSHILIKINPNFLRWIIVLICFSVLISYLRQ